MENLLSINNGFQELNESELTTILGGGIAYDLGHFVGSVALGVITVAVAAALL